VERVPAGDIVRIARLFRGLEHHLALVAILRGYVAAPVYADELECPALAFTWTQHRAFLGGSPSTPGGDVVLRALLDGDVWPSICAAGEGVLVFHDASNGSALLQALAPYQPKRYQRDHYVLRDLRANIAPPMPEGYALRAVDAGLLADATLSGREALREEMLSERPSVAAFWEQSFGVCALQGSAIVGWCLSEYNTTHRCEVGIATAEGHRQRGIATAMTGALVAMARDRGLREIGWHCWTNNLPSAATARAAGFAYERSYPVVVAFAGEGKQGA
jgi:RimJ/RimL family protein N-acetyltransferase